MMGRNAAIVQSDTPLFTVFNFINKFQMIAITYQWYYHGVGVGGEAGVSGGGGSYDGSESECGINGLCIVKAICFKK